VEEDGIDDDEANEVPLHNLGPPVPLGPDGLQANTALELALEAELLLLGELEEIGRPLLPGAVAVEGEVEGRELRLGGATEEALEQL